jgi:multiple sugar transport system substrate-binding protein
VLEVWVHSGQPAERKALQHQIKRYNANQREISVRLTVLPEGTYNGQVQAAALAGDLPDLLEFDGPYVYNYAWQQQLIPLDGRLSVSVKNDLLPSILAQGTYRGRLYSVGQFDSGLGLYARRSHLQAIQARIPKSPQTAWMVDEFEQILAALAQRDPDGAVLDLKLNYRGEWFAYGFSPIIQSAGGDLINRSHYQSAANKLNGPEAIAAMRVLQGWIKAGYVDLNLDDAAFVSGRVSLSWVGHWEFRRYSDALGKDLVVLPLPDFGDGPRSGLGSWNWGISAESKHPDAAIHFLEYLLKPEQVLAMSKANGAVPATRTAIARSETYGPDGPLHLFARQLIEGLAVPRPKTPAYPIISSAFENAFLGIRNSADVQASLDNAVRIIDQDIRDNHGYPQIGSE